MRHEIIPNLRYADAPRAIDFLCDAFGFRRRAVYLDDHDPDIVQHAQLEWGDRMVMLYSMNDTEYARAARVRTPAEAGGPTVGLYLIVDDVDAHAERARAPGADIFLGPDDKEYGGRGYSARDPEGNVWSFGSDDPWAWHASAPTNPAAPGHGLRHTARPGTGSLPAPPANLNRTSEFQVAA